MARKDTPSAPLPDDVAGLDLSPEAAAALAEVTAPAPATPAAEPTADAPARTSVPATRPSAAARAGIENPNDELRVGTAAIPGVVEYVYGDAKVTIRTN